MSEEVLNGFQRFHSIERVFYLQVCLDDPAGLLLQVCLDDPAVLLALLRLLTLLVEEHLFSKCVQKRPLLPQVA